ncbi:putative T7SS-secreted protein [Streptomyces sp. NPDC059002]|uniref:WXG100 family type VII secretion target n=1 Tax=Streptomyces sp. NPDC059002 TaxID=3346690 RepID=UPI003694FDA1
MAEARLEDFHTLGFVPCPGDHAVADDIAKKVRGTAKALVEICHVLHGTGVADWKGKAAEGFREKFDDEFRPKMDDARDSFRGAASALEDWAEYMERKQKDAKALETRAAEVAERLSKAYEKVDKLDKADNDKKQDGKGGGKKDDKDHERDVQDANRAVNSADIELSELRSKGRTMRKNYQAYGGEIAGRLKSAMDIAPNEPGMWEKLGNALEDLGKALADLPGQLADVLADIGEWMKSHADWITVLASVVGVVAIFCPVLAPLAIGLSAVAFMSHAAAYGTKGLIPPWGPNASNWLTLGGDALGMVPGVGAAMSGAKAGLRAGRAAQGFANGTKVGLKTAGRTVARKIDEIDPVSKVIQKPLNAGATKLGVSRGAALTAGEGVQAATNLATTAPTALNAYQTSKGRYDAATWGTGAGNVINGSGGGKFGGAVAIGSVLGLGAWEISD